MLSSCAIKPNYIDPYNDQLSVKKDGYEIQYLMRNVGSQLSIIIYTYDDADQCLYKYEVSGTAKDDIGYHYEAGLVPKLQLKSLPYAKREGKMVHANFYYDKATAQYHFQIKDSKFAVLNEEIVVTSRTTHPLFFREVKNHIPLTRYLGDKGEWIAYLFIFLSFLIAILYICSREHNWLSGLIIIGLTLLTVYTAWMPLLPVLPLLLLYMLILPFLPWKHSSSADVLAMTMGVVFVVASYGLCYYLLKDFAFIDRVGLYCLTNGAIALLVVPFTLEMCEEVFGAFSFSKHQKRKNKRDKQSQEIIQSVERSLRKLGLETSCSIWSDGTLKEIEAWPK